MWQALSLGFWQVLDLFAEFFFAVYLCLEGSVSPDGVEVWRACLVSGVLTGCTGLDRMEAAAQPGCRLPEK